MEIMRRMLRGKTSTKHDENISNNHLMEISDFIYNKSSILSTSIKNFIGENGVVEDSLNSIVDTVQDVLSTTEEQVKSIEHLRGIVLELEGNNLTHNQCTDIAYSHFQSINNSEQRVLVAVNMFSDIIEKLNAKVDKISTTVENTIENYRKIKDITAIVNDINSKIELLTLNASIEAARVGNGGRGFVVIADELRKLSTQTEIHTGVIEQDLSTLEHTMLGLKDIVSEMSALTDEQHRLYNNIKDETHLVTEDILQTNESIDKLKGIGEIVNDNLSKISDYINSISETALDNAENATQTSEFMNDQNQFIRSTFMESNKLLKLSEHLYDKSMEIKMYAAIGNTIDWLEEVGLTPINVDKACTKFKLTILYVADKDGKVHFCNDPTGRGVNLFKFDNTLKELLKGVPYVTTPIKPRVEDGKMFKFLAVIRNEILYEIGISV